VDAIRATASDTEDDIRDMQDDEAVTRQALKILGGRRADAYEAALAVLREDTQEWWSDRLAREPEELDEVEEPATPDRDGLRQFIEDEVLPWFKNRKKELANRPLIREQAFGESLNVHKLERLGRYEVHLDRKLERMLSMLLRLKEMRQGRLRAEPPAGARARPRPPAKPHPGRGDKCLRSSAPSTCACTDFCACKLEKVFRYWSARRIRFAKTAKLQI
jgi:hypothetical protein